jgi:hypothetical protein
MCEKMGNTVTRDEVLSRLRRERDSSLQLAESCAYEPLATRCADEARVWQEAIDLVERIA